MKHTGGMDIFQGGGSGSSSLCVGDVSDDPLDELVPGGFPLHGGLMDNGKASTTISGSNLVLPPPPPLV